MANSNRMNNMSSSSSGGTAFAIIAICLCGLFIYGLHKYAGVFTSEIGGLILLALYLITKVVFVLPNVTKYNYILTGHDQSEVPSVIRRIPFLQVIVNFNTVNQLVYIVSLIILIFSVTFMFIKPTLIADMLGASAAVHFVNGCVYTTFGVGIIFLVNYAVGWAFVGKDFELASAQESGLRKNSVSNITVFMLTLIPFFDITGLIYLLIKGGKLVNFRHYHKDITSDVRKMQVNMNNNNGPINNDIFYNNQNNQNNQYNNNSGNYNNQQGYYDNQGNYNNQQGNYDNQQGNYNNQQGNYDDRDNRR